MIVLITLFAYFMVLFLISRITGQKATNQTFYQADHKSPWYMVAFGMIGASISGVTYVSVPGMVTTSSMTYLQTCLGFIPGYFIIAFVLLPLYYKSNITTIYTYLKQRIGKRAYKTGAIFFLISKMLGASLRFYLVCIILQTFVCDKFKIPFFVTVTVMVALIWLYTHRGGIKTLVWTDSLQTLCLFVSVILIIVNVAEKLNMDIKETTYYIINNPLSRVFIFDDWTSPQYFWKQFISGAFIVVVMTGLDQDMMQKNLTCRTLKSAQKDMCTYGFAFIPANILFLALGILLVQLAAQMNLPLPSNGDELLPMFAATGQLGTTVIILFTIGIVAASFSSADSALTSLTTCYCIDILENNTDEKLRRLTHICICIIFIAFIFIFKMINSEGVLNIIYILCSYTYGPLLGIFAFGILTKRQTKDKIVPVVTVISPILCLSAHFGIPLLTGYKFGYELLLLNGLITFIGLYIFSKKQYKQELS